MIKSIELDSNVKWNQIISNKKTRFIVGFQNSNAILFDISKGSSLIISDIEQGSHAFLSSENLYFGMLGNSGNDKKVIQSYSLEDRINEAINFVNFGEVIDYFLDRRGQIFYCSIQFEKYRSGNSKGGLQGGIFKINQKQPMINFEYFPPPPPNRISLPIIKFCKGEIYLAIEDKYNIDIYASSTGIKKSSIIFSKFKNKPYSQDEIQYLSPMHQAVIREGISVPPIIKKIDVDDSGYIYVTRYPRPGSGKVIVDIFSNLNKYTKYLSLNIEKDDTLVDSCIFTDHEIALLIFSEAKYIVKIFSI